MQAPRVQAMRGVAKYESAGVQGSKGIDQVIKTNDERHRRPLRLLSVINARALDDRRRRIEGGYTNNNNSSILPEGADVKEQRSAAPFLSLPPWPWTHGQFLSFSKTFRSEVRAADGRPTDAVPGQTLGGLTLSTDPRLPPTDAGAGAPHHIPPRPGPAWHLGWLNVGMGDSTRPLSRYCCVYVLPPSPISIALSFLPLDSVRSTRSKNGVSVEAEPKKERWTHFRRNIGKGRLGKESGCSLAGPSAAPLRLNACTGLSNLHEKVLLG